MKQITTSLTAPLCDEGVHIHEEVEELEGLIEARFLSVEGDHECPLQGLVAHAPLAPRHEGVVDGGVKDRIEELLALV